LGLSVVRVARLLWGAGPAKAAAGLAVMALLLGVQGCSPSAVGLDTQPPAVVAPSPAGPSAQPSASTGGPCPTTPVAVVVVENFYGSMLEQLGGQCVRVTSILTDPSADPHEYQPSVNDARSYQDAQLVVQNGLGYDDFSDKIVATLGRKPGVLNLGETLGLKVGDNPHIWYGPDYVDRIARAMTDALKRADPSAAGYFDEMAGAYLDRGLADYRSAVERIQAQFKGTPVGSTESIFVYMARGTGLSLISPPGLMNAVAESSDPAARDLAAFQDQITRHQIKILVYNTQTESNLTEQLKKMAAANNIPLLGVSETMPRGARSFQDWQTSQLEQLNKALASSRG
jgi:zinc/manganese transport system substrate-binding protein